MTTLFAFRRGQRPWLPDGFIFVLHLSGNILWNCYFIWYLPYYSQLQPSCYSNFLETWRSCCTWLLIHCSVPAQWHSFWLSPSRSPPTLSPLPSSHYFIHLSPFTFTWPLFGVSSLVLSCLMQHFSPVPPSTLIWLQLFRNTDCGKLVAILQTPWHLPVQGKGNIEAKWENQTRTVCLWRQARRAEQLHPDLNSHVWEGLRFVLGFKYSKRLLKTPQL